MIVTDTYRKNAKRLKEIIKTSFSLSDKSFKDFEMYVDDPLLILNDNAKRLLLKYENEVVDYRIPIATEELLQPDPPGEIFLALEMLNDFLFDEYSQYRTFDNNCDISIELLKNNKFILFGQERKLWRFLKQSSEKMAQKLWEKGLGVVNKFSSTYSIGPMITAISRYYSDLGLRETSLSIKIKKLLNRFKSTYDSPSDLAKDISILIQIISDIFGARNINNPEGYKSYLSFNFFDWFLASTGENWSSCISLDSDMCYGLGLVGLFSCPDWGMILVAKKDNKSISGIEVPHVMTRSWAVYGNNKKYNLIGWYPHNIKGKITADKPFHNGDIILSFLDWREDSEDTKGATWFKPFYLRNDSVPFIYADCYSLKVSKTNNFVRIDVSGRKSGLPAVKKYIDSTGENKFSIGGNFEEVCDSLRDSNNTIKIILLSELDAIEEGIRGAEDYCTCECCEERCHVDEMTYVENYGDVCESCIQNNTDFFFCSDCETWHYGDCIVTADSEQICDRCSVNYFICEECGEYYNIDEKNLVNGSYFCDHCTNKSLEEGTTVLCDKCGEYVPPNEISHIKSKNGTLNVCELCVSNYNYCKNHDVFYRAENSEGCHICLSERENEEKNVS